MSFIHQKSCECVNTELDLFTLPPTQTTVESAKTVVYKPISSLTDDSPIEFVVPGTGDEYTDLAHTYLHVVANILKSDGTKITTDDMQKTVGPVNNWLHSLFNQVDVFLNQKLVSPQNNTYAYRAYLETFLNYGLDAKDSHLTAALWKQDAAGAMDDTKEANNGLVARRTFTTKSDNVDMVGHLHVDMCNQRKYLLNGVELRLRLVRSKDAFSIMTDPTAVGGGEFKVHISEANLFVRRCRVSKQVMLAHSATLEHGTAKYPITRVEVKTFTLPSGIRSKTLDNLFLGQVPKRIIVGLVDNRAYNGDYKRNPFNFHHFKANYFCLYVDGEQIPSIPWQPKYGTAAGSGGEFSILPFHSLFTGTGTHYADAGNTLDRSEYSRGYCLMAFDLTPDLSASDTQHWNLLRNGSVRMEIGFAEALADTVNCLVYAEFDNVVEIDRQRNVTADYGS